MFIKINFFIKKSYENYGLQTSSRPFSVFKKSSIKGFWGQHANLDKAIKLCYCTSNISSLIQKFHFPIEVVYNYFQTQRSLALVFRPQILQNFFMKFFFCNMTWPSRVSLTDCVYFQSYSVKCISCFMLRHLMTSWNLKMLNSKIWFSLERKELLK